MVDVEVRRDRIVIRRKGKKWDWMIEPRYWRNTILWTCVLVLFPLVSYFASPGLINTMVMANIYAAIAIPLNLMTVRMGSGIISSFTDGEIFLTDQTIPFVKKMHERKIPTQIHVHLAYADIYFIKKVIENAGGTGDIDKLIRAMETSETTYSLGKMAYETKKVKPFFHSKVRVDPNDPMNTTYPGVYIQPMA